MSDKHIERRAIAKMLFDRMPPSIQGSILSDREMREALGIGTIRTLKLGNPASKFNYATLYQAIDIAINSDSTLKDKRVPLKDANGSEWFISRESTETPFIKLSISNGSEKIEVPDFSLISNDRKTRIKALEEYHKAYFTSSDRRSHWNQIISQRPLTESEIDQFRLDIHNTPMNWEELSAEISSLDKDSIEQLVPDSREYYQNLIGEYEENPCISDFISKIISKKSSELLAWSNDHGMLICILFFGHQLTAESIELSEIDTDKLIETFSYVRKLGDPISVQACIEIGINEVGRRPELKDELIAMIESVTKNNAEHYISKLKLYFAIFTLVDGQLAKKKTLSEYPPFYRRMASLTHAGLIFRLWHGISLDEHTISSIANIRAWEFITQSLVDMQKEPRWNPCWHTEHSFRNHFLIRTLNCAGNAVIPPGSPLHHCIFGDSPGSLLSSADWQSIFGSGPLNGDESEAMELTEEFSQLIENALCAHEVLTPEAFIPLINLSMRYKIKQEQVDVVSELIVKNDYRFSNIKDRNQLLSVLNGLAAVAAGSRSTTLAKELRVMVRRYKLDPKHELTAEEMFYIILSASASQSNVDEWCKLVSDWLGEIAFGKLTSDSANWLFRRLRNLSHSIPRLWLYCSQMDVALKSQINRW